MSCSIKIVESQCFRYFSLHSYKIHFESHANYLSGNNTLHNSQNLILVHMNHCFRFTSKEDKDLIICKTFCSLVDNRICSSIVECPSRNSKIRASQVDPMKFPLKRPNPIAISLSDDHHLHICWWDNSRSILICPLAMVLKLYKTPAPKKAAPLTVKS